MFREDRQKGGCGANVGIDVCGKHHKVKCCWLVLVNTLKKVAVFHAVMFVFIDRISAQ